MIQTLGARKAVILSAGQGSRLLPLTESVPKCLLDIAGHSLLEWQLLGLRQAGVTEAVIVTGFRTELVERRLSQISPAGMQVRALFNPFFQVADNLASCWMARHELTGPVLILNGDTLFDARIAARLCKPSSAHVVVTIDRKAAYDEDDMKITADGDRLRAIGKKLPMAQVNGESIGFLRFDEMGARLFVEELDQVMRTPEGTRLWYLSIIHRLAQRLPINVLSIEGLAWAELDYPADLQRCRDVAALWLSKSAEPLPRAATP